MKIIKIISLVSLIFLNSCAGVKFSGTANQPVDSRKYVLGSADIPLLTELTLIEEESSSFDTTEGSIINSKYSGDLQLKAVKEFYLKTLPQMGWKVTQNKSNQISFAREKDKLEIKLNQNKKILNVRFFISSAN